MEQDENIQWDPEERETDESDNHRIDKLNPDQEPKRTPEEVKNLMEQQLREEKIKD